MKRKTMLLLGAGLLAAAAAVAAPAMAQGRPVAVTSGSYVDKGGEMKPIDIGSTYVVPGDIITFVHDYKNNSGTPVSGFLINNPLATAVRFLDSPDANIVVSTDGGRTYGPLAGRNASAVTHVRWQFAQPIPPGGSGKVSFRGVVR